MTQNLKFRYISEEDGYEVVGYIGKPIDLVIDSTYQGKNVVSIGKEAFINCKSIISITLPETVKIIRYSAFEGCASLEYVDFPNGLEKIEWRAFHECSSLSFVEFPDSVTEICESSFTDCTSMTSISIGSKIDSLDLFAFEGCLSLERINVSRNNASYSSCDGILTNKSMTSIIFCPYGRGQALFIPEGIKVIESHAFSMCKRIVCLYLPNSLEAIGENAFEGCSNLSELTIPGFLKQCFGNPFDSCSNIREIHFHEDSLVVSSECLKSFLRCYSLQKMYIPHKVKEISVLGLTQCSSFEEFIVDDRNEFFSTIEGMLCSKDKTELLFCPRKKEGTLTIPEGVKTMDPDSIHNCYKLDKIIIPRTVIEIMPGCFCKSKKIKDVVVDDLNNNYCSINGILLTKNRRKLIYWPADNNGRYVEVPNGVEVIGTLAFTECSNITSVTFSLSVKEIEQLAFLAYSNIDSLIFKGSIFEFNKIKIDGGWRYESIKRVYCSDGTLPKRALKKMFSTNIDLSKFCD